MKTTSAVSAFITICVLVSVSCMDVDNGDGGDSLKNLPCVMRFNQLYCSEAGTTYPTSAISTFTDDNKALLRRMFGELQVERPSGPQPKVHVITTLVNTGFIATPLVTTQTFQRFRRDVLEGTLEQMIDVDGDLVNKSNKTISEKVKRQADFPGDPEEDDTKSDVCESKIEVSTPYWASNSNGKVRAILNNKEFEQAVHQEICTGALTLRCNRDCSCEQKYKWHRLLAYDPNNDCAGIFMDWFLFPSCCVCRCNKNPFIG